MARALGEARVVNEYKDIIEKGKEKFKKELEAALPDVKLGEKGQKLTEEELNFLIAHAHRRVEQLQRRLAKQMVTEQERIQKAMEKQQEEDSKVTDARVSVELANQQRELEISYQKDVNNLKEEFEHELRQQLRRQAAAHSDHLQEVLLSQQKELSRKHDEELKDKLLQEKTRQLSEMAESMSKLKGIENTLKAREELDKAAKKAQKLWLACQALKQSVKSGRPDEEGYGQPKPLDREITAINEAAEKDKPYVAAVLAGIPKEALHRGVYTEESLKERFHKVNKVCRRVALIDENGGSLYRYLVSYLQSLLVIESAKLPAGELNNENEVDPSKWHTFDILTRIRHSLDHENLEQALRYANQLKGEPRNVARDWIKELRLLLETRQAADALIAHAAAVSVQAYH
ncbi:MICOS complex subunit MIC60-like [Limulus polyphemus]|uniref:MICOS complex subunit MIC60 n=1 Tax=Limulus polyphemus TaxID=6850 RepID=A0ABM1BMM9_LIMPO|nr:MICOS complex subunit MIC60-like [Limulus polyphemus]